MRQAPEARADQAEAAEETIEIRHGEEGTEVRIQDPSLLEVAALVVIVGGTMAGVVFWGRRFGRRRRSGKGRRP